ncbi:glycosyltransferase family 2 protein [Stygiolobus caldivivus]|uniref:Glycosyl transferase n=1 Tax=Stygiolobus caldivivus TaxID=2824673 RepID=A0A8D5ZHV9_9CREN|nr:glycosyltransferase family 2 protein [Stygiolobus caldivivus]BCU69061.1 glycosyl transferase [Stygiolobus caldivivus]
MDEITIVIINYNGLELLKKYLRSVLDTDYPNKEVVVVDNGSKDGSVEYLKSLGVRVIPLDKNYGPAYARNVAIKTFKTKYMAFLDNDVYTPKDWLLPLYEVISSDERVAACQSLYTDWPYGEEPREIPWFSTAAALTRRDYIEKVGGFDDYLFFYWEDADLSWRLYRAGYKVLMVPKSKVLHEVHGTFKKLPSPFTSYLLMRNQLLLLLSYYNTEELLTLFPFILTARFISAFRPPNRKAKLKGIFSALANINYVINKRKQIREIEKVKENTFLNLLGDEIFGYPEMKSIREAISKRVVQRIR